MMNLSGLGIRSSGFGRCEASSGSRIVLALVAVVMALGCGHKSDSQPATLFPETNQVPGWSEAGEMRTFRADNLWEYIDGDADRYLQAGVERTLAANYVYQDKTEAQADIYIMKTADGARKIFGSESSEGSQRVQLGEDARLFPSSLVFRKGRYLVRLTAFQDSPEVAKALTELGRGIERKLNETR